MDHQDRTYRYEKNMNHQDRTYCYEKSMEQSDTTRILPTKTYLRLLSFVLRKQTLLFGYYIVLSAGSGLLTPLAIARWKAYIDLAAKTGDRTSFPVNVSGALGIYLLLNVVQSIFHVAMENVSARFNFASWFSMDKEINLKAMALDPEFFEIPKTQAVIDRAWYFTRAGFVLLFQLGLKIFSSISTVAGLFLSIYILDKKICLVSMLTIVPTVLDQLVKDREAALNRQKTSLEMLEYDYFKNILMDKQLYREIKLNDQFGFFSKKFEDKSRAILKIRQKSYKKRAVLMFASSVSRNVILIVCLFMAACLMVDGRVTIGGFAAVYMLITELIKAMTEVAGHATGMITSSYSANEFFQFLDLQRVAAKRPPQAPEASPSSAVLQRTLTKDRGDLEFDHVSFRYPLSDNMILKDITLTIKKGEHVAVVGANGSGKSTFIKLIAGMIEPSYGAVRLGSIDIAEMVPALYRNHVTAVFQDYNKYKESLGYNIFISDIRKKDHADAIKSALDFAGFHKELPLDTVLSAEFGGIDLSGGEWQKVAIARAFFGNKEIVILDEPTAAIDPLKEAELYDAFDQIGKGKTVFFVTHRLGSALSADRILFFEDGRIVENGTHEELIGYHGRYARFWQAQAGLFSDRNGHGASHV